MLSYLAEKYFSTVSAVLDEKLPDILYLGSRFAEWGVSGEVVHAAAKYVDVMSFNCYKYDINQPWMNLGTYDMPIIIGEFSFHATDRGMFAPGYVPVSSQAVRASSYEDYMKSVFENPNFVGAHWFQYMDQPIVGRAWDGENGNVGFVDITDTPHPELVSAARNINLQSYDIKFNYKSVETLTLDQTSIELDKTTSTATLNATILPADADNKAVTWASIV